nr:RHS repeat-associated core domain-containing protein [Kibdelosporangium sp. MJ126-NF4]
MPVYGDDANEPCHKPTFAESSCVQGYRWNLDKVVDRHGNMIQYFYQTETNHYGQNKNSQATPYVRGGWLERIDYGLRVDNTAIAASGQVHFAVVDRCVPGSVCTLTKPDNLPDVPLDLKCDGGTCVDKWSPSFWTTKHLRTITTKVRKGTEYVPVDTWTLRHELPDPGDGEKAALWLKGITRAGLPEMTFDGARKPNRVHGTDGYAALIRFRMNAITSETGGITSINYAEPECVHGSTMPPNTHDNKLRCFPVRWTPKMSPERTDYFHKYVVASVAGHDGIAGTIADETSYEYLDGAAWHWDTSEFTEEDKKTWNDFRGFGRVRTRKGSGYDAPKAMTEQRFYRGMHGDKYPGGTRPPVNVADTEGGVRVDSDWLQGTELESAAFEREGPSNQSDPPRITKTISVPTAHGPTATRASFNAYIVRTGDKRTYTALAAGGWRTTRTVTTYDTTWGLPTVVNDLGDTTLARDDLCVRTTYAPNTAKWLINYPARMETVSVHCGQPPGFPGHAVSDVRNSYDNQVPGTAPATGNVTRLEQAAQRPASGPVYITRAKSKYDTHGRAIEATDALGNTTTTAYTPAIGGPVTQTVTTTPGTTAVPAGMVTTTTLDPARGLPTLTVDPNDHRTELTYDALGRTKEVWLPNRPKASNPNGNYRYDYQIHANGPNVVTTTKVGPRGNYTTINELFDGLLRARQAQAPASGGGRLLTDTRYDSHGRVTRVTHPYFNDAPVDAHLWFPFDNTVPGATITEYDHSGRPKAEIFRGSGREWRTETTYGGDRVTVTPPPGGSTTTTITDARGRTSELRQHNPTGFDATTYAYTPAGKLAQVVDPGRNVWSYDYDLLGRKIAEIDPDKGRSSHTYDNADRIRTTTDARNLTLAYRFDALGRKTELHRDSLTGPRLADWTYDTVSHGKGHPDAATRYVGGNAYVTRVAAYTPLYQRAKTETVIPAAEGKLAGTYTSLQSYEPDGSLASETYGPAGGLLREGVGHSYDDLGKPAQTWGGYDGSTTEYVLISNYTRYGEPQRLELGEGTKRAWLSYYYEGDTRRLNRTIVDAEVPRPMQADTRYTYDDAGNVTSIADNPRELPRDTQCFRYDHLRRLAEAWTPISDCGANPSVTSLGGAAPYWHRYTYDAVGNRRTETQHAAAGDTTRTYTNTGHRVDSVATNRPGGSTLDTYGYDPSGNTTARSLAGINQTLDWDLEGHLTKVAEPGKESSYVYDADGIRLLRREPGATTLYLNKQEIRLDTTTNTTTGIRYYTHGDKTIAVRTQAGVSWLGADHHDTTLTSINSSTLEVTKRRMGPFGAPRGDQPRAWPGDRGFVGGPTDASTGLTHLGARDYDPTLARFISVDPVMDLTDPQQMHGYTYSNNNPATLSDPDGLCPIGDYPNYCEGEEPPRSPPSPSPPSGRGPPSAGKGGGKADAVTDLGRDEYTELLSYIYLQMMRNSQSKVADKIRIQLSGTCYSNSMRSGSLPGSCTNGAMLNWIEQVWPGEEWDHKSAITAFMKMKEGGSDDLFTPLPDPRGGEIAYDVWSNIHYGFVGKDVGIDSGILHLGADLADMGDPVIRDPSKAFTGQWGKVNKGDRIAVQIGIDLRKRYAPEELTPAKIANAIRDRYDELEETGKIRPR